MSPFWSIDRHKRGVPTPWNPSPRSATGKQIKMKLNQVLKKTLKY